MSQYPNLKPISASSIMNISNNNEQIHFLNCITYDYQDNGNNEEWKDYYSYLLIPENYALEFNLYKCNLQEFLNKEKNKINGENVRLNVIDCYISFRDHNHPFVQWIIEFEGNRLKDQVNTYENIIEPETIEYPIFSLYIFQPTFVVTDIISSIQHKLNSAKRIIQFSGDKGDSLNGYEAISFKLHS